MNYKVMLLLTSSIFAVNSFAQSCVENICIGDNVIDSSEITGSVLGIDSSNNQIIYQRTGYSSINKESASNLSDEVSSTDFPIGKLVLDEYEIIGQVKIAFRNGKVLYQRNGYSSNNVSANLSPAVEQIGAIKVNSRVIDEYNLSGSVKALFKNGKMSYLRDGYSSSNISKNLAVQVLSYGDLATDDKIVDNYDLQGKIQEIYADGRVKYLRSGYSSFSLARAADLSPMVSSAGGLKEGMTVIDQYNLIGTVRTTYKDERVFYLRNGYSSESLDRANNLSPEVSKLDNIVPGILAIDEYDIAGHVLKTFADGRIAFMRNGYSAASITKSISPEVPNHRLYSKEIKYATDGLSIGKPTAFFSNEKIQLNNQIVSVLYERVGQLGNLGENDLVLSLDGNAYPAIEMYANAVIQTVNDKKKEMIVKLVSIDELDKKDSSYSRILQDLSRFMNGNQEIKGTQSLVVLKEDMPILKNRLLAQLKKSDDFTLSQEMKTKLEKYISSIFPDAAQKPETEEYSLSVTPANIIDAVIATLDAEGKKYV
ncbi:MAG: hypothetical protein ACXVCE_03115, partial [Bacteriovorax sp.]